MAVTIKCTHCGATIKSAKPVPAGKKVKCPKCAKPFVVQGDAAGKKDQAKPATTPAAAEDDNPFATMGPGDPSTLAKHKNKKSSAMTIVLGCGCLVLLSCCCGSGGAGFYFQETVKGWVAEITGSEKKDTEKKEDEKKGKSKAKAQTSVPALRSEIAVLSQFGWHALRYSEGRDVPEGSPRPSAYRRACHTPTDSI
jgi:hypothetical protein